MAINTSETKNRLFGNIAKHPKQIKPTELQPEISNVKSRHTARKNRAQKIQSLKTNSEIVELPDNDGSFEVSKAKWQNFDKVTALLTTNQKEGLDRIAKKIMKFRSITLRGNDDKERITTNTLLRAIIEYFLTLEDALEIETLSSEDDVHEWVKKAFNHQSS